MKYARKIFVTLLLLLLLVIIAGYVVLQTRWGAEKISQQISKISGGQFSVRQVEHDLSHPDHLILHDVSFRDAKQHQLLTAKRVELGLQLQQLTNPLHFASILLNKGAVTLNDRDLPAIQADKLQLQQMAVNSTYQNWSIQAQQVTGGMIPWQPQSPEQARFQASAEELRLNGIPATHLLIEGQVKNNQWTISDFGLDAAHGAITGRAQQDAAGHWQVTNLRLNNIRLQTQKSLHDFIQPLLSLPETQFGRVDITDARLEGQDWAVTDLDLVLQNITLKQGQWQSQDGSLKMNASSLITDHLQFDDPIASLHFSSQGVELSRLTSRWSKGLIRTHGSWNRHDKKLTLDELVIAGLEYTLPLNWRTYWMAMLPDWLHSVEVKQFNTSHNLLIDINPTFPFQITSLEGTGHHLLLAQQQQWGMWNGELSLNAAAATFNRIDLRQPSLILKADNSQISLEEFSALNGKGLLEGHATISQHAARFCQFTLEGKQIDGALLPNWGWPTTMPLQGNINIHLTGNTALGAEHPLRSATSVLLQATSEHEDVQQQMTNGELLP